jgi:thiol-disulfide isomerase/thioredoxin
MNGQGPGDQPVTGAAARTRDGLLRSAGRTRKIVFSVAVVILAGILIVVLTSGSSGQARHRLPVAKGFTLAALGQPGRRVSLSAYAGRPVIINFFASWCGACRRETPLLARFYTDSRGRTMIIGVDANDQLRAAERFIHAAGVSYPVGFDPYPATATTSYGVLALPQTFFLNARHRVVKRVFGAVTIKELTEGVALMDGRSRALADARGQGTP